MKGFLLSSALALATTGLATAAPITIDDFSADQVITSGSNGTVDDPGILGGERDVVANGSGTTFTAAGGSATFGTTGAANFVGLDYDGIDDSTGGPAFLLGDVTLTGGGMNDRFLLDVTSITGPVDLTIRVSESSTVSSQASTIITSAGLFEFTFASIGVVDYTSAQRVLACFTLDTDESITINNFSVGAGRMQPVPEPSSAALMGLGLCAFAVWRKKRQTS